MDLAANIPLCQTHLGIAVSLEPEVMELVQKVRVATSEVIAGWSHRLAGNPFVELRGVKIDPSGKETGERVELADIRATLAQSQRVMIEAPGAAALAVGTFRYYQYGERTVHLDGCVEVEAAY